MFKQEAHLSVIKTHPAGENLGIFFIPIFVTCLRWSCSLIPHGQGIYNNFTKQSCHDWKSPWASHSRLFGPKPGRNYFHAHQCIKFDLKFQIISYLCGKVIFFTKFHNDVLLQAFFVTRVTSKYLKIRLCDYIEGQKLSKWCIF